MDKRNIPGYLENLALLMQESAETGNMDSGVYASVCELMGGLASLLREGAAA